MTRRWTLPLLLAAIGLAIAFRQTDTGSPGAAVVWPAVFLVFAVGLSPLAFPRSISAAEARRRSADDVRAVTGGDETVPTVVVSGQSRVNPDAAWLRRRLK